MRTVTICRQPVITSVDNLSAQVYNNPMNISLREFQRQASMYIKSLDKEDIILTQYNIPIARVTSVDIKSTPPPHTTETPNLTDADKKAQKQIENFEPLVKRMFNPPEEKPWVQIVRCEYQTCRKDAIGNFSIETYSTDTGDQTIQKHLCKLHKHLATKEGKVTET